MAPAKKNAEVNAQTVLWVDESSVYLLPMTVRTFAPKGQTPVLRAPLTHDHLSVISAITHQGDLFFAVQSLAYRSEQVIAFLQSLLDQIPGRLIVIWDGAPIHRSRALRAFLAAGAAHRLHLERLPGYAPDLNPDEGVWSMLKRTELANQCYPDLASLTLATHAAMNRLQSDPHRIRQCFGLCPYLL